ncbi:PA14 domain-containing protein [Blastopirellula sp. J2-11]|uniref:PA14 domain-containing protein n=1 Tax=Blastopirellula sp. J2-11 TaxID=2943192 RepID=UPI0021C81401|nr:PA14 domain-containing protein [Blastopirellula sp. J2-11]UUO04442.1 PA14 domain-containing protein [Blastopirellula sp. J2-11]
MFHGNTRSRSLLILLSAWSAGILRAEQPTSPVIPAYERFYAAAAADDVAGGRLLVSELNCVACHPTNEQTRVALASKTAPDLSNVGARVRPSYFAEYLSNVHGAKPGTTMPQPLRDLTETERAQAIESLTHFLASTGSFRETRRREALIAPGKTLFQQVGCVGCHNPDPGHGESLATSKPLGDLAKKYSVGSLASFLQDPLQVRHSGRMPSLNLRGEDATAIAQFLLPDLDPSFPANLRYKYYEVNLKELPDFAKLEPKTSGEVDGFSLSVADRQNNYAIQFEGLFAAPREGEYEFYLISDDGSRLLIDGQEVVSNDGIHPESTRNGKVHLSAGKHSIVVQYFDGGGQTSLAVEYRGPKISRREVFAELSLNDAKAQAGEEPPFEADPALIEQGKQWFAKAGCASCHASAEKNLPPPTFAAKPLLDLNLTAGCLAETPSPKSADYHLTAQQKSAIRAALQKLPQEETSPELTIQRTMTQMNCYACHARNEIGGVEEARNPFFATTQQEMGDEGRIPPHLNGVGGKLKADWLAHILKDGAKDRPYMTTRMPKFGGRNVGKLKDPFEQLDSLPAMEVVIDDTPAHIKAIGRHMVGDKVFGCIKCHTFDGVKASGVQGIDMTLMTKRLDHTWFHRYVVNPPGYRPGTRMPTAWPNGQSVMKKILDGDTEQQIEAIWQYLNDGTRAAKPFGVGGQAIELASYGDAIMYRNFIEGAGTRAIGVGYAEHGNLAIDANEMRLALIWQGAFMDAARHWSGRGQGFQPPLGDNVYKFASGPDFFALASETDDWPPGNAKPLGIQFKGYHLDDIRRPTFRYRYDNVDVSDFYEVNKSDDFPTITRTIRFVGKPTAPLYYRAATGDIQDLGDGRYKINQQLTIQLSPGDAIVRSNQHDLLIPIRFQDGEATIRQTYAW